MLLPSFLRAAFAMLPILLRVAATPAVLIFHASADAMIFYARRLFMP